MNGSPPSTCSVVPVRNALVMANNTPWAISWGVPMRRSCPSQAGSVQWPVVAPGARRSASVAMSAIRGRDVAGLVRP
ncbi:MAG TPA: hypothetical protein VHZ03_17335 [Trebonia sp.]|nr:hypothetical protein [Trebonia sp.]